MKTISAILLSLAISTTPAMAKTSSTQMPKAIQGTWYPNNSEGKEQCAAYRRQKNDANRITALVITPKDATAYNPNGEDETYELQKVTNLSRQSWKLFTKVLAAGVDNQEIHEVRVRLKQGQLYWSSLPSDRYFKCL